MKNKPIILVAGEPNSIFLEIFFKAIKFKRYNSPLILICCKKILLDKKKKNKFKKKQFFKIWTYKTYKNLRKWNFEIN